MRWRCCRREAPTGAASWSRAAEAAGAAGRLDEAEQQYEEAEGLFRASGDDLALGETLARRARNMHRVGDSGPARVMAEESVRLLERLPPSTQLARAYGRAAGMALVGGRYQESLDLAGKALALAERLGLQDEVVRARQFRGSALCELGNADGVNDLREAVRMGLELGLGEETALAYGNLAYQLWLREGPAESLAVWQKAAEFAQQRGFEMQAMWSRNGQLEALFDLGRWDEVLEISERVITLGRVARGEPGGDRGRHLPGKRTRAPRPRGRGGGAHRPGSSPRSARSPTPSSCRRR